jgi:hypothetical protein
VVYQVTKSTTRLLVRDSSSRRRPTLATVQARLLAVHFYLEALGWPAEFVLEHERKIAIFTDAGCPPTHLLKRGGNPYLHEHFVLWLSDGRVGIAMIDPPQAGALLRLRLFIRQFLPLLRYFRGEPDLLVVTAGRHRRPHTIRFDSLAQFPEAEFGVLVGCDAIVGGQRRLKARSCISANYEASSRTNPAWNRRKIPFVTFVPRRQRTRTM